MLTASAKFKDHLKASHRPSVKVGVWLYEGGAYVLSGYLGVMDGSLTIDYSRNVRRQASITLGSLQTTLDAVYLTDFDTRDYLESLTTSNARLTIEWGLLFPDGTSEYVTLATLRVEEFSRSALAATVQVTAAYDDGSRVTDFPLIEPFTPYVGSTKQTYVQCIQQLVEAAFPSATLPAWIIGAGVDITSMPPDSATFSGSRWGAINSLAQAINVTVGADALGAWRIDVASSNRDVVWDVASGEGGVLVDEVTAYSRRDQYNAVPIRWEQPDGTGGLAYITDNDPASPTYYDGPFGRKPRAEETLSTVTTMAQAEAAAATLLDNYKGNTRSVSFTSVHNPLLESGDVIGLYLPDGSAERHVIDSLTIPLTGGTMSAQTRIVRGGITYNETGVTYDDAAYNYAGQAG